MKDIKKVIYSLNPIERKILPFLYLGDISIISQKTGLEEAVVTTGVHLLEAQEYAIYEKQEQKFVGLDKFGIKFENSDLPEIKFLKSIEKEKKLQANLGIEKEEFSSAIGIVKRLGLVNVVKQDAGLEFEITEDGLNYLKNNQKNPLNEFSSDILEENLTKEQKEILNVFKPRKGFLKEFVKKTFSAKLTKNGKKIAKEIEKNYKNLELIETLDSNMLKSNSFKNQEFRHYDIAIQTRIPDSLGRRHPMVEANNILKDIFLQMGFSEMQGPMVESAFWNMDALWIPQDHPARDEQDTFYLDGKAKIPADLVKKVKEMHEKGIKRTHTLKDEFSEDISVKRLLRTHSTPTSFRLLAELGKKQAKGEEINGKYFYIANNFRNEAVDATHLAEFFQAEGFIIGDDLSLADLMGFVRDYYLKLGFEKIKFKPTFNPYTEPSMEAHIYDDEIGKWYALINSGIFRPETLEPMGIKGKTILAWGIGASRVAAKLANKTSMRDITGFTCDLEWLRTRELTRRYVGRDSGKGYMTGSEVRR